MQYNKIKYSHLYCNVNTITPANTIECDCIFEHVIIYLYVYITEEDFPENLKRTLFTRCS